MRVDSFLAVQLRNYSSWRFLRLAATGHVRVDDQPATPQTRVFSKQLVTVSLRDGPDKLLDPAPADLEFIYRDHWLAVINKPPGFVVHPTGPIDSDTLSHHLQDWLDRQTEYPGLLRPGIVHRLDRETSGALVVAFEATAHRGLALAFEESQVSKSYLAIVEGIVERDRLQITRPIGRARNRSRVLMSCHGDAVDAKRATTAVRVLQRFFETRHTLVRCIPRTGRNHQIRVHLAAEGHPLVGDEYYRAGGRFHSTGRRQSRGDLGMTRHALHAERLAFAHPIGNAWVDVTALPASDFSACLRQLVLANF